MADQQAERREVFAVQAFLDKETEDRIMRICEGVMGIEGIHCPFSLGMSPHFTIGSWWGMPSDLKEATPIFSERLAGLDALDTLVELEEHEKSEPNWSSYFLVPEMTQQLQRFHAGIHDRLGYPYEPYREIDLPGSWWPHLLLFGVPKDKRNLIENQLASLREITKVRIARLGLVIFHPEMVTMTEVRLK